MRSKRKGKQRFNAREPKLKKRGRKEEYTMERKNAWAAYAQDDSKVEAFAKAYRDFIDNGKTERRMVALCPFITRTIEPPERTNNA